MNLRGILFDNWGIKLISLLLSVTLWFYVTSKGKTEMTLTVPLQLRNIPQGMTVVGNVAGYIDVRVQGQERLLRDITSGKKVGGVLNLSMTKEGENTVRISPDNIDRPSGVAVTYISPPDIKVKLEPLVRKTFRLRPLLHGAPAAGYRVAKISVIPPKISIDGPASAMATLDYLQTMPIDIQGAKADVTVEPKIDYQGQPVKLLEQNISVRIIIERKRK
jgi:YbbR domain-containing protein